ncbi:MAG: hypothetical protein NVSMB17_14580 [Candidatus Dormibacteria bacterium]
MLLLGLTVFDMVRLGTGVADLRSGASELRLAATALGMDPAGWSPAKIAEARQRGEEGLQRVSAAQAVLAQDPLIAAVRRTPLLGDQAMATVDLASAAVAGGRAFRDELAVAAAYRDARQGSGPPGGQLVGLIQASVTPLNHAASVLGAPVSALKRDSQRPLLAPLARLVREALDLLQPRAEQASAGASVGRYLPAALGASGARSYLLLFPNPAELRPAGGFSGVIGSVKFVNGTPIDLQVQDSDAIDRAVADPFPPPEPIARYNVFNYGRLNLGDNLEPDFPTQAGISESMVQSATGQQVDGTFSIDPYAIEALLAITGPVDVPAYGRFDSTNFFKRLDTIVNVDKGPDSGKVALVPISKAMISHVLAQPLSSYLTILTALQAQVAKRHLQLSLHDPQERQAAALAHADGAIVSSVDDYVMVVDANIGATKGDYYLHKSLKLKAELPAIGVSRHQLTMRYELPLPVDDVDRALNPYDGSYHDYVRFYLPETATVRRFQYTQDGKPGTGSLDSISTEHGKQVVGVFFILPRGHVAQLKLDYEVALTGGHKDDLYLQKQAGIPGFPIELDVTYPDGRSLRSVFMDRDQQLRFSW